MSRYFGHAGNLLEVLNRRKSEYTEQGISWDKLLQDLITLEVDSYISVIRYSENMVLGFSLSFDYKECKVSQYPVLRVYRMDNHGNTLGRLAEITNVKYIKSVFPEISDVKWYYRKPLFQPDGSFTEDTLSDEQVVKKHERLNVLRKSHGYVGKNLEDEIFYRAN